MPLTGIERFVGRAARSLMAALTEMAAYLDYFTDSFVGFAVHVMNTKIAA